MFYKKQKRVGLCGFLFAGGVTLNKEKGIRVELFIVVFYLTANAIQLTIAMTTRLLLGDFFPRRTQLSDGQLLCLFLIFSITYLVFYRFYRGLERVTFVHSYVRVTQGFLSFLGYLVLTLILANMILLLSGLKGKGGQYIPSSFSFLLSLMPIEILFIAYYILSKDSEKIYWQRTLNLLLYILVKFLEGFTGVLLSLFLLELYLRKKRLTAIAWFLLIALFLVGIMLYSYLLPLKHAIRKAEDLRSVKPVSLDVAASAFVGRLSMFGNMVVLIEDLPYIVESANEDYPKNFIILKFLRTLVPSFMARKVFPENIFAFGTLGVLMWKYSVGIRFLPAENGVIERAAFGVPFLGVICVLAQRSLLEALLFPMFTLLVLFYIKALTELFRNKELNFLIFSHLLYFVHELGETLAFTPLFVGTTSLVVIALIYNALCRTKSGYIETRSKYLR